MSKSNSGYVIITLWLYFGSSLLHSMYYFQHETLFLWCNCVFFLFILFFSLHLDRGWSDAYWMIWWYVNIIQPSFFNTGCCVTYKYAPRRATCRGSNMSWWLPLWIGLEVDDTIVLDGDGSMEHFNGVTLRMMDPTSEQPWHMTMLPMTA